MTSVRKITYRSKNDIQKNLEDTQIRKISRNSFYPQTRAEKIRSSDFVCPTTSQSKIVFPANKEGNGFKNEPRAEAYPELAICLMKKSVDRVCYQTWKSKREHLQKQTFSKEQKIILLIAILLLLCFITLFMMNEATFFSEQFFLFITIVCVIIAVNIIVIAVYIFMQNYQQIYFDRLMIYNIKNRLAVLNKEENEVTNNHPRFVWSCNKQATWIAVRILESSKQLHSIYD